MQDAGKSALRLASVRRLYSLTGIMSHYPFLDASPLVKWSELKTERVVPDMEKALELGQAAIAEIIGIPDGAETFQNTFLALEAATLLVSSPWDRVNHLDSVNDHKALRTAHKQILPKVSAFFADIPLNKPLYLKLRAFSDSPAARDLEPVEARFVRETLKDFEDAGANLEDSVRNRLREIEAILSEKTKAFSENILDSTNAYERIVDSAGELAGLPDSFVEAARLNALAKGIGSEELPKYRFTLQAPSYIPAMRFLESDALRRELFEAHTRRGHYGEYENEPLIREILQLRQEKARLLGRSLFPDWILSRRMAKSGRAAMDFVEDLQAKTKPAFDRENHDLMEFKSKKAGLPLAPLEPWERLYWSEKMRRERFDFDEEVLRPYFPLDSVMDGMLRLSEHLFGLRVEELKQPKPDVWHADVRVYAVHDSETGTHLGTFYTDWFPREPKQSGAWMHGFNLVGEGLPRVGMIVGNLTPPVGDKPALLNHRDVETVFHEYGHLLHHLLSEVHIQSLSGTNVTWDFVELPSQIMENWCWERDSLDLFARHYETGEPIPEDLFQKLCRVRNFGSARTQMGQLSLAKMDLSLHMEFDPAADEDLDGFIEDALQGYQPPASHVYPSSIRSFHHLFGDPTGYASGYYSYKWAEVLDADAFTRFMEEGILNPETGRAFRRHILAKGNTEEPDLLFRAFRGRDPDPLALLKRLGLTAG